MTQARTRRANAVPIPPSGLILKIWELAGWIEHPTRGNGPWRWRVPIEGGLSLWDLAVQVQDGLR